MVLLWNACIELTYETRITYIKTIIWFIRKHLPYLWPGPIVSGAEHNLPAVVLVKAAEKFCWTLVDRFSFTTISPSVEKTSWKWVTLPGTNGKFYTGVFTTFVVSAVFAMQIVW